MAIYHLSVKAISRSHGRSSTAAAAYRAAARILDQRTGMLHDFTKKRGVLSSVVVLPKGAPAWASDRSSLWNAAEQSEKRKDACVAREIEVSLPAELSTNEREKLALKFAQEMADIEGCAVDVCIHAPGKGGDSRNHHVHMLRTTRKIDSAGFGKKLDTEQAGRARKQDLEVIRERWATLINEALERAGEACKVDHRSLAAQGIDREPTVHLGPFQTAIARRLQRRSYATDEEPQQLSPQQERAVKKLAVMRTRLAQIAATNRTATSRKAHKTPHLSSTPKKGKGHDDYSPL